MMTNIDNRRLYRKRSDRVIAGVCSGLGDYFDIDPVIARLVFVFLVFAGGAGLLAYIVLAVVLPEEETNAENPASTSHGILSPPGEGAPQGWNEREGARDRRNRQLIGLILLGLGAIFMARNLGWLFWFDWSLFWPLILIGLGVLILLGRGRNP